MIALRLSEPNSAPRVLSARFPTCSRLAWLFPEVWFCVAFVLFCPYQFDTLTFQAFNISRIKMYNPQHNGNGLPRRKRTAALELLSAGFSISEVARRIRSSRQTVAGLRDVNLSRI